METKDGHLFSSLQTRKIGVVSRERRIVPWSENLQDVEIAAFIESALAAVVDFEQVFFDLLDALAKGISIIEVIWEVNEEGRVVARYLKSRRQARFTFDQQRELRLIDPVGQLNNEYFRCYSIFDCHAGIPVPPRKFIVLTSNAWHDNQWGRGLCARANWYYWLKTTLNSGRFSMKNLLPQLS